MEMIRWGGMDREWKGREGGRERDRYDDGDERGEGRWEMEGR